MPSEKVMYNCPRCGAPGYRLRHVYDRHMARFGEVWCEDCQHVARVWRRRGGELVDLPPGAVLQVVGPDGVGLTVPPPPPAPR